MERDEDRDRVATEIVAGAKRDFTPEELEVLSSFAKIWLGLKTLGKIGEALAKVAKFIGAALAIYLAIKGGLVEWIKQIPR